MNQRGVRAVARFGRSVVSSQLGWLIAVVHAALLILAIVNMSPPNRGFADSLDRLYASGGWCDATVLAGRPFHFHYESLLLKIMFLVDLPALLAVSLAGLLVKFTYISHLSLFTLSYAGGAFWMLLGSVQWLIVGNLVERRLAPGSRAARLVGALTSHRHAIIILILVIMVLLAPLLQYRSNALGFRHGGISFEPR